MPRFDFLFSRNMLIYFDDESRKKAAEVFAKLLKPGGYLFLGHADLMPSMPMFSYKAVDGIGFYRRFE